MIYASGAQISLEGAGSTRAPKEAWTQNQENSNSQNCRIWTTVKKTLTYMRRPSIKENTERLDANKAKIDTKADDEVVQGIQKSLLGYAKYEEMKALYHKVLP